MNSKSKAAIKAKVIPLPFKKITNQYLQKIAIATQRKVEIIDLKRIIYFKASSNYTEIHLDNMEMLLASITLKKFEQKLNPKTFLRIHQGYIVNSNYISAYLLDSQVVQLTDSLLIPVSRSKRPIITQFINQITL